MSTSTSSGTSTATRHQLCVCGQDLDDVRGDHCPRCGSELKPA